MLIQLLQTQEASPTQEEKQFTQEWSCGRHTVRKLQSSEQFCKTAAITISMWRNQGSLTWRPAKGSWDFNSAGPRAFFTTHILPCLVESARWACTIGGLDSWTHRNRGAPWPLLPWAVTGGRIAAACPRNPRPQGWQGAGFHCGQSVPIAYGSVCRAKWGMRNGPMGTEAQHFTSTSLLLGAQPLAKRDQNSRG